jgi:quercetin dioxygenase-like cupin family protein
VTQFDELGDRGPPQLFTGFLARAVHGERITMAVVEIDPGAELPEHRHEHEQLGLVIRGSLIFRIGEEERELGAGGIWRIPSNAPHSATAGPDGAVVLDVFNPTRDDWKALEPEPPRTPVWP